MSPCPLIVFALPPPPPPRPIFLQSTGIDAAVYYSPVVFRAIGLQSTRALLGATLAMGTTKVAFIVVSSFLLDHFGRRPLLLASTSGGFKWC